ncbi:hypothetical protein D3C87_1621850 [compost metagenome]
MDRHGRRHDALQASRVGYQRVVPVWRCVLRSSRVGLFFLPGDARCLPRLPDRQGLLQQDLPVDRSGQWHVPRSSWSQEQRERDRLPDEHELTREPEDS